MYHTVYHAVFLLYVLIIALKVVKMKRIKSFMELYRLSFMLFILKSVC